MDNNASVKLAMEYPTKLPFDWCFIGTVSTEDKSGDDRGVL